MTAISQLPGRATAEIMLDEDGYAKIRWYIPRRLTRRRSRPSRRRLSTYIGHLADGARQLRADLNSFAFLLSGDDGEHLLAPGQE